MAKYVTMPRWYRRPFEVMPKEYPKYKKYWEEMTKKKEAFVVFVKE